MVSTRRAPHDEPPQGEAQQAVAAATPEDGGEDNAPETPEPSLSPRRKQVNDEPDGRDEKRRQATSIEDGAGNDGGNGAGDAAEVEAGKNSGVEDGRQPQKDEENEEEERSTGPRAELEATAGQLLKLYACTKSFEYLSHILSRPLSRKGRQYKLLYEEFQRQRRGFPTKDNFISASLTGVGGQRFARCVNFVTFAASMLGSRDASFSQLNEHFYEVFIDRTGGRTGHLLKLQADILLGLKTQAYIAQAAEKSSLQESLLNDLFPSDTTTRLQALQPDPGSAKLVASEQTFVKQIMMRKRHLLKKDTPEAIASLKDEYKWNDVLKSMLEYLRQHFEEIARRPSEQIQSMNDEGENDEDVRVSPAVKMDPTMVQPLSARVPASTEVAGSLSVPRTSTVYMSGVQAQNPANHPTPQPPASASGLDASDDILMRAMQAANKAMDAGTSSGMSSGMSYSGSQTGANNNQQQSSYGLQSQSHQQQHFTNAAVSPQTPGPPVGAASQGGQNPGVSNIAPNGQSHPTHQLYEMAREATTGQSSQQQQQPARRTGSQSQRRPWTQEEEKALLDGLDAVNGPHWSMILQLYGPGGKISEVLRDRNQVQLKDKARNLKLWFLKSGGEVPASLRSVTGELKTRAPAAIRNAAAAAAAAAQAQPTGASSSHSPAAQVVQHHQQAPSQLQQQQHHQQQQQQQNHAPLDPNLSNYASASPFAATVPPSAASGTDAPMTTAAPGDAFSTASTEVEMVYDEWAGQDDLVNHWLDECCLQVMKNFDADPDSTVDQNIIQELEAKIAAWSGSGSKVEGNVSAPASEPAQTLEQTQAQENLAAVPSKEAPSATVPDADILAELGLTDAPIVVDVNAAGTAMDISED